MAQAKTRTNSRTKTKAKTKTAVNSKTGFDSIDAYIASFPEDVAAVLEKMRRTIAKAAPRAEPVISYQMPAYKQGEVLLFFSAWKKHFSLFVPSGATLRFFRKELAEFEIHKATVKIPLAGPIPYDLIAAMTRHRVREVTGDVGAGTGADEGADEGKRPVKTTARRQAEATGRKPKAGRSNVRKARA